MANSSHPAKRSVSDAGGTVTPAGDALTDADYRRLADLRHGLRSFLHWSAAQAKHAGLTPTQHQLLLRDPRLEEERGPTLSDIAALLLIRHHSAVELVDRAQEAGLIVRERDPEQQSTVRLHLTAHGTDRLGSLSAFICVNSRSWRRRWRRCWRRSTLTKSRRGYVRSLMATVREQVAHLGDFTLRPRVLTIVAWAIPIGAAGAVAVLPAPADRAVDEPRVLRAREYATGRAGRGPPQPLLILLAPMAGGLSVGLMARYGSEMIRGHGIPEALEAILFGKSQMSVKVAILKPSPPGSPLARAARSAPRVRSS